MTSPHTWVCWHFPATPEERTLVNNGHQTSAKGWPLLRSFTVAERCNPFITHCPIYTSLYTTICDYHDDDYSISHLIEDCPKLVEFWNFWENISCLEIKNDCLLIIISLFTHLYQWYNMYINRTLIFLLKGY